jgi:PAS domain S-box-containing protein
MSEPARGTLEICMAQKANMEAIFHSVADGIVTVDEELRVTNLNVAAQRMLAAKPEDVLGLPLAELVTGKLWDLAKVVDEVIRSGERVHERENVVAPRDGREVRVLASANKLVDREGNPAGAVAILRDITELRELETRLENRTSMHRLVGSTHAMQEVYGLIEQAAPTDSTILVLGESGTGKELIADAIHRSSRRQRGPFVKVNCSALSEGLLESELFGHVRGAFTGAIADRKGRFELAHGGTIFLDEIGDLTERIQVKLLRVLQEHEIERVGDTRTIKIDVRVIAATHRPLKRLAEEGRFREDLYFRLNVIPLRVPPLRERCEDIPSLAALFLREFAASIGKRSERLSPDALRALLDYRWPGNIRELRNAIEHAIVKGRGAVVMLEDLPREIIEETARVTALAHSAVGFVRSARSGTTPPADTARSARGAASPLADPAGGALLAAAPTEADRIREALARTGWHRGRAAALLGIDRATLWRRMRRLGMLERNRERSR